MEKSCNTDLLPGSKIVGESGATLVVDRVEGDLIVCGDRRIQFSAVVKVLPPMVPVPPPAPLAIGNQLRRRAGIKNHLREVLPELVATIEKFSPDGFWVRSEDGRKFHVSSTALDLGEWEAIDWDKYQYPERQPKPVLKTKPVLINQKR